MWLPQSCLIAILAQNLPSKDLASNATRKRKRVRRRTVFVRKVCNESFSHHLNWIIFKNKLLINRELMEQRDVLVQKIQNARAILEAADSMSDELGKV